MSRLQTLPPDQRAVLQLLLQKDRSYDEIAQLLRLDRQTIRARAHEAVASLGPAAPELSDDQRGELTDFLLGEQAASARAATRAFLEGSPAARGWARDAAEVLHPLGGDRLPEIPAEPAGDTPTTGPAPTWQAEPRETYAPPAEVAADSSGEAADTPGPTDKAPALPGAAEAGTPEPALADTDVGGLAPDVSPPAKRSSRIGSLLLVGGLGLVIAVVVILGLRSLSGDDESENPVTPSTPPAAETTARTSTARTSTAQTSKTTPNVNAELQMRPLPESGGKARATATLITQSGQEAIAIAGQDLQPTTDRAFYGLWFANSRSDALFLGYAPQVGENGRLRLFDSLPKTADPSQYKQVWLTREVVTEDTTTPTEPGSVALQGDLPD